MLHQNEEGREEKTKSKITEGLIPFPKAASGGWRRKREGVAEGGKMNTFNPFAMAAYFFVLIPPRLLISKAPALWRTRTECD